MHVLRHTTPSAKQSLLRVNTARAVRKTPETKNPGIHASVCTPVTHYPTYPALTTMASALFFLDLKGKVLKHPSWLKSNRG